MVFIFVQETIAAIARTHAERAFKLYLDVAICADQLYDGDIDEASGSQISLGLLSQALILYEEKVSDGSSQYRCISSLSSALLTIKSISNEDYESMVTKTAQFSAKILKKHEQCQLIGLCAHLFYPTSTSDTKHSYQNAQRSLECLQRSLKLADACTSLNPGHISLFVDLLEHYIFFFESGNPLVTHKYISGLIALVRQHLNNPTAIGSSRDAKQHFGELLNYIREKKANPDSSSQYSEVQTGD